MNEVLITNWNHRVKDGDLVIHAGDFCFKNSAGGKKGEGTPHKYSHWESKLNGKVLFIRGNHDGNNSVRTIIENMVIKYGPHYINITHVPDNYDDRFAINFVGHVHQHWKFQRMFNPMKDNYTDLINIGVDVWNFQPVTFEEIYSEYRRWNKTQSKKFK